jgi:Alpha-(1,6)-fucosyltransferase N- and catalytic domains
LFGNKFFLCFDASGKKRRKKKVNLDSRKMSQQRGGRMIWLILFCVCALNVYTFVKQISSGRSSSRENDDLLDSIVEKQNILQSRAQRIADWQRESAGNGKGSSSGVVNTRDVENSVHRTLVAEQKRLIDLESALSTRLEALADTIRSAELRRTSAELERAQGELERRSQFNDMVERAIQMESGGAGATSQQPAGGAQSLDDIGRAVAQLFESHQKLRDDLAAVEAGNAIDESALISVGDALAAPAPAPAASNVADVARLMERVRYMPLPSDGNGRFAQFDLDAEVVDALLGEAELSDERKRLLRDFAVAYVAWRLDVVQFVTEEGECERRYVLESSVNKGCGFGCQLHHSVHCFKKALETGRLYLLASSEWSLGYLAQDERFASECATRALPKERSKWSCLFKEIRNCALPKGSRSRELTGKGDQELSVRHYACPIVEKAHYGKNYWVPEQLKRLVASFHADPPVWLIGQLEAYMMRPAVQHETEYAAALRDIAVRPLVVFHVRRTDKIGSEASRHGIAEYVAKLDELFAHHYTDRGLPLPVAYTLHLMTDEPAVVGELSNFFDEHPERVRPIVYKRDASINSGDPRSRRSIFATHELAIDLYVARHADFLVGTFSSQISRAIYELMQSVHIDPSDRVKSLDDGWYH